MGLLSRLFPPPKPVSDKERALVEQVRQLDEELEVLRRQDRQRDTLYLLEQEVAAITGGQGQWYPKRHG